MTDNSDNKVGLFIVNNKENCVVSTHVVQCKSCIYREFDSCDYVCTYHFHKFKVKDDDFCNHGTEDIENKKPLWQRD